MDKKEMAVNLINKKLNNETFMDYKEIAEITGYHPKYISKLKKEILNGTIQITHGNKNRKPINAISDEEKEYIIKLYKRSNASIRQFCQFYNRRSYSCIYNILNENGLINHEPKKKVNKKKKTVRKKKRNTNRTKNKTQTK